MTRTAPAAIVLVPSRSLSLAVSLYVSFFLTHTISSSSGGRSATYSALIALRVPGRAIAPRAGLSRSNGYVNTTFADSTFLLWGGADDAHGSCGDRVGALARAR